MMEPMKHQPSLCPPIVNDKFSLKLCKSFSLAAWVQIKILLELEHKAAQHRVKLEILRLIAKIKKSKILLDLCNLTPRLMLGVFRSLFFLKTCFWNHRMIMIIRISQHCPGPWQFWDPQWVSYIACLSLLSIVHWSGLATIRLKLLLMSCPPTNLLRWGRSPPPLLEMAFLLQFFHRPSFWNEIEHCQLLSGFSSRLTKSVLLHLNWPWLYKKVFQLHASSRQGVFTMTCAGSCAWNTGASFHIWKKKWHDQGLWRSFDSRWESNVLKKPKRIQILQVKFT